VQGVCGVLEDFDMGCVPGEVLDELLVCVAKGSILWVHPAILGESPKEVQKGMAIKLQ